MRHLQAFQSRDVRALPLANEKGWQLKRYAILSEGRDFDNGIASSALAEALARLPKAGQIGDEAGNHGVGFQIIHFAEVAVVSPVFYWQWGSVLANIGQMRAPWDQPTSFGDGESEVVGCVWEMDLVSFEIAAWKDTVLGHSGTPAERLASYGEQLYAP
ncbi:hypothetical protein [Denitrobaculum tricleocarpae]|uniref:Uncharacterized protein n=1 Tax=Denitrobaculum tricleocarpae TaxID=2591009 RepID=A0A545TKF8_9PROT|nr:hypothetical protein [Denitrobaculum tricleocarpae]TQV77714.1 hypothetical protein FKG95_19305 [Denitrobaculum tricleocarpae]